MRRKILIGLALAMMICLLSACTPKRITAEELEGAYIAQGTAQCVVEDQDITYPITVRVAADENGSIIAVADDGTVTPEKQDAYYTNAWKLYDAMEGKDRSGVGTLDAVAGATYSSTAMKEAVDNAMADIEAQMAGQG